MSQYFLIVNPVKRQYIDASRFDERTKASGFMRGYHATAVALLVCQSIEVGHRYGPLAGSWYADPIIAAGDDHGQPDQYGFATSTSTNPDRNLYQLARDEFEDISYQAIAMLCLAQDGFAEEIAEKAAKRYTCLSNSEMSSCLLAVSRYRPLWRNHLGENGKSYIARNLPIDLELSFNQDREYSVQQV
jgi:hypothetical protein